ncbi:MAG: patatin family protein [Lachnospiraceae bacterium]|nr:patatin family protein [Lachnospiraceae bacterium]
MKTGLVLEGGGMRGMFTCGVLDVFMENGITFDGAVGVSAGAVFGCNYKSGQVGRPIRYNKKYCNDKRYMSVESLVKTGDMFGVDFCYNVLPNELDVFDREAFKKNPMEFYVTATNVETGKAVFYKCSDGGERDLMWMRASASMPLAANIVEVDGYKLLDGGVADSVPIRFFEKKGFDRNVVILTQPKDYVKKSNKLLPVMQVKYARYPKLVEAIGARHVRYNLTSAYIDEKEAQGELFVIRPEEGLDISRTENDPEVLERVYQAGRKVCEDRLEELKNYLGA